MRWATRSGVHIDRAACAWLIRRFIDPQAQFVFVADPARTPGDATGFDMRGVDLSHHTGPDGAVDCSFETILRRHDLIDPVLWRIAEIVHEADIDDERYDGNQRRVESGRDESHQPAHRQRIAFRRSDTRVQRHHDPHRHQCQQHQHRAQGGPVASGRGV